MSFDPDKYARSRYWILDPGSRVPRRARDWADAESFSSRDFGDSRRVAYDDLGYCSVSTVFLWLDHAMAFDTEPILFETMVFGGPLDQEMERYATWSEAAAGHARMVLRCTAAKRAVTAGR